MLRRNFLNGVGALGAWLTGRDPAPAPEPAPAPAPLGPAPLLPECRADLVNNGVAFAASWHAFVRHLRCPRCGHSAPYQSFDAAPRPTLAQAGRSVRKSASPPPSPSLRFLAACPGCRRETLHEADDRLTGDVPVRQRLDGLDVVVDMHGCERSYLWYVPRHFASTVARGEPCVVSKLPLDLIAFCLAWTWDQPRFRFAPGVVTEFRPAGDPLYLPDRVYSGATGVTHELRASRGPGGDVVVDLAPARSAFFVPDPEFPTLASVTRPVRFSVEGSEVTEAEFRAKLGELTRRDPSRNRPTEQLSSEAVANVRVRTVHGD